MQIVANQSVNDYLILNYDNDVTRELGKDHKGQVKYFSRIVEQDDYVCVSDDWIVVKKGSEKVDICPVEEVFIQGSHNLENALAATAICYYAGISPSVIREGLKSFKGVEHRFEWVDDINGVRFYNDSKRN